LAGEVPRAGAPPWGTLPAGGTIVRARQDSCSAESVPQGGAPARGTSPASGHSVQPLLHVQIHRVTGMTLLPPGPEPSPATTTATGAGRRLPRVLRILPKDRSLRS